MTDHLNNIQPGQPELWAKAARQRQATALAHPNIAFIKYWGNADDDLVLPANASLSMNLGSLQTVTTISFDAALSADTLTINDTPATEPARQRVTALLNLVRAQAGLTDAAAVVSTSNVPMGSGIASSAAAFAALSVAASAAA